MHTARASARRDNREPETRTRLLHADVGSRAAAVEERVIGAQAGDELALELRGRGHGVRTARLVTLLGPAFVAAVVQ